VKSLLKIAGVSTLALIALVFVFRAQASAGNLHPARAEKEHGGRKVLGGVDDALDSENFLCAGDWRIVGSGKAEVRESGAKSSPRSDGKTGASGTSMQIQAQLRAPVPYRGDRRRQQPSDRVVPLKYRGEPIFHNDGDFEIGTACFEDIDSRSGQNAVPE